MMIVNIVGLIITCWLIHTVVALSPGSTTLPGLMATNDTYTVRVTVARCHISCVKKFGRKTWTKCAANTPCNMCLDVCSNLVLHYAQWSYLCGDNVLCKPGCPEACRFINTLSPEVRGKLHLTRFPRRPTVTSQSDGVTMDWSGGEWPSHDALFVLLYRSNDTLDWHYLTQTEHTRVTFNKSLHHTFRILAVSLEGTVADMTFTSTNIVKESMTGTVGIVAASKPRIKRNRQLEVQITERNHTFVTVLTLHQPNVRESNETNEYELKVYRHNCNVYRDVKPTCSAGSDIYTIYESFDTVMEQVNVTFVKLWYNTNYEIVVRYRHRRYGRVEFNTPRCGNVQKISDSYSWCSEERSNTVVSETIDARVAFITHNLTKNLVLVRLEWRPLVNLSGAVYSVSMYARGQVQTVIDMVPATPTGVSLTLKKDHSYKLLATAVGKSGHKISSSPIYLTPQDFENSLITSGNADNSTKAHLNDSSALPQQEASSSEPPSQAMPDWLVAVMGAGSAPIIAAVVFILYKKRKNFKNVIITKNFPLQCNNYMYKNSAYAVPGKSYYANEFVYVSDYWEIDPSLLEFSCILGQGAFGKVMTAFLADRRVAVKVVREGAPVTYKEDLLAEIYLMKKLGCHPNIVSLVGACTQSEPIALVMEYVPYGNLQTFLKKCRLESELRRKEGEGAEMVYTMVDAHGSIEEGVVTPADILMFARQVAMAMEYLAEKKYVHRDLAARNVLLDYNKVVKVCDFGLSRDIFNTDNQYKKLTSGKLPLKWMALESLRDRVFTTRSDVWSFGILLWEIVTMGASPYPHVALSDLFYMLSNGFRMDKPSNCSDDLYVIMRWCWAEQPDERPNFTQLREHIEALLTKDCNYLDLESIDVPLSNDTTTSSDINTHGLTYDEDDLRVDICNADTPTRRLIDPTSSIDTMPMDFSDFRERLNKMKSTNM